MARKYPAFKLSRSKDGQFYWTLVASNGRVVATSETYRRKGSALKGMKALQAAAKTAALIDET